MNIDKLNAWDDPFFRYGEINAELNGLVPWFTSGGTYATLSLIDNPVFDGRALQKTGNTPLEGPSVYMSRIGAAGGDQVTVLCAVTGTATYGRVSAREDDGTNGGWTDTGQQNLTLFDGTTVHPALDESAPLFFYRTFTLQSGTKRISIFPFDSTDSGSPTVVICGLWAWKGSSAGAMDDLNYLRNAVADLKTPRKAIDRTWCLPETRQRLRMLERGLSTTLDIGFIGDSYTQGDARYVRMVAQYLAAKYGDGGMGWMGFGFTSPTSICGTARSDLYTISQTGTWTSDFHTGASASPNVSNAKSSSAGAKYTITATGGAAHASMDLYWEGTADGVVSYAWNGGSATNLNVQGSGIQKAALSSVPGTSGWTLDIAVVSGSVNLCGLNGKTSGAGVRVHKLAASGAAVSDFLASDATKWKAGITYLALNAAFVLFGINDKSGSVSASTFASNLSSLLARIAAALPVCDLGVILPASTNLYDISGYVAPAYAAAKASNAAWLNLQPLFGTAVSLYEYGSTRGWISSDHTHPVDATVAPMIPDGVIKLLESA